MYLYLVRHGEAKREGDNPARGLTKKGIDNVNVSRIATFVQKINVKVSRILHSGKARAKQAAQMLADNLKPEKGISETDSLAPMDDSDIWIKRINGMNEDVMFVAHLPYMAKLTGVLLCGDKMIKRRHVSIKRWGELSVANALTIGDGPLSG